jgi:hypothetical protein
MIIATTTTTTTTATTTTTTTTTRPDPWILSAVHFQFAFPFLNLQSLLSLPGLSLACYYLFQAIIMESVSEFFTYNNMYRFWIYKPTTMWWLLKYSFPPDHCRWSIVNPVGSGRIRPHLHGTGYTGPETPIRITWLYIPVLILFSYYLSTGHCDRILHPKCEGPVNPHMTTRIYSGPTLRSIRRSIREYTATLRSTPWSRPRSRKG